MSETTTHIETAASIRNGAIGSVFYAMTPLLMATPLSPIAPVITFGLGAGFSYLSHRQSHIDPWTASTLSTNSQENLLTKAYGRVNSILGTNNMVSLAATAVIYFGGSITPIIPLAKAVVGIATIANTFRARYELTHYNDSAK